MQSALTQSRAVDEWLRRQAATPAPGRSRYGQSDSPHKNSSTRLGPG